MLDGKGEAAEPPAAQTGGIAKVYLVYDSTLVQESHAAVGLSAMLHEKKLVEVKTERDGEHEQLMKACDGVLLLRSLNTSPDKWLELNARELSYARQIYQREREDQAEAVLAAEPARVKSGKDVLVFPYRDPCPMTRWIPS